jgi:hypothetical protein
VRDSHSTTGTALILVASNGENVIAVVPGANATVLPGDVAAAGSRLANMCFCSTKSREDGAGRARSRRARGAVSLLNTAPYLPETADQLGLADYVIANETEFDLYAEALQLEGESRGDRMLAFAERFANTLIVTLGKEGAIATREGDLMRVSAPEITPVDTVGRRRHLLRLSGGRARGRAGARGGDVPGDGCRLARLPQIRRAAFHSLWGGCRRGDGRMSALASARTGLGVIGALCGAAGVAFSALAAHAGGNGVATAAQFLLFHAPLFVALALLRPPGGVLLAAWGILPASSSFPATCWRATIWATGFFPWRRRPAAS